MFEIAALVLLIIALGSMEETADIKRRLRAAREAHEKTARVGERQ